MPPAYVIAVYLCVISTIFSGSARANGIISKINGNVTIYSGIYYNNRLLTINVRFPNQCYNIDCNFLDNKLESARWDGLPTTGIAGKAYIVFYEDFGCKGHQTPITLPHFGGIRDFDVQKVKGQISAFMIKSQLETVDNGFSNVCSWTGANVVGGYVSQDDSLSMVVNPATS
ncbi:hypothetical protein PHPALM_28457 [Phytophthora palmivora]|uniref:Uncharacterized protein n=1 Tax=Phytophthora palmivora TaxID=4796 RepID=A0A2P4XA26_9STRA|nr:hypothetical protein PHPALM_28457 [Phytophthora palmivora]